MQRIAFLTVISVWSLHSATFAGSIFLPASAQSADGSSGDSRTLGHSGQARIQVVYGAAHLGDLVPGSQVVGIAFRVSGGDDEIPAQTVSRFDISLSTSQNSPGSLSSVFADNIGPDVVQARSGSLVIEEGDYPGGSGPNPWGKLITFSTPFTYSGGDLLVDIARSRFRRGGSIADGSRESGLETAFATSPNANSANLGIYSYAPTVQLVTASEPSTPVFWMFAALAPATTSWRRKLARRA